MNGDDPNYTRQMREAGRGHLISGPPLRAEPEYDEHPPTNRTDYKGIDNDPED